MKSRRWLVAAIAVVLFAMLALAAGADSRITLTGDTLRREWQAVNTIQIDGDTLVATSVYTDAGYAARIEVWYATVYSHAIDGIPAWPEGEE